LLCFTERIAQPDRWSGWVEKAGGIHNNIYLCGTNVCRVRRTIMNPPPADRWSGGGEPRRELAPRLTQTPPPPKDLTFKNITIFSNLLGRGALGADPETSPF
jgi:hypothetical protein